MKDEDQAPLLRGVNGYGWRTIRGFASVRSVTSTSSRERSPANAERAASDADLVARMARGDKQALAQLYDRYSPVMLSLGSRMLSDRREAEDLVHDVFLEAWHSASLYDQKRGTVATWLLLRMRSRTLDRLRSAGRTRTVLADDPLPLGGQAVTSDDPHAAADRSTLLAALRELPAEQRSVLELGYFCGLSSSEIAEQMGVSIGTVKSRTAAGLSKLRTRLASGPGDRP